MLEKKTKKLITDILKILQPPPDLDVMEWADMNRVLSKESAAEPGRWSTARTPYMIEIYKTVTKKYVQDLVVMAAAQLAKSELLNNVIGRYIEVDPCPMLMVQPTDDNAIAYSKERIGPMIRDTPSLRKLVKDPNQKNSGNTLSHKTFFGGFIAFVGTFRENKLASRPIRLLLCDEVDRYAKSSGNEGSPLELAKKRTTTFVGIDKRIITGTPTVKGSSEIEMEYDVSTMGRWYLPCPHCEEYTPLKFENLTWNEAGEEVKMVCPHCGGMAEEWEWKRDNQKKGKWIHEHPERLSKQGFHLNALVSPWRTWESIVKEWLDIEKDEDDQRRIVFINTVLAETYEEEVKEKVDWEALEKRVEDYFEIPEKVLILTCGVDIQDKWIEYEVVGWGIGEESWGIEHGIILGNPQEDEVWNALDVVLEKKYYKANGNFLNIYSTCIDTGGHNTERTYDYVNPRQNLKRVYGIKGLGGEAIPINNGFRRTRNNKIDLLSLGVNALKDITYGRLKIKEQGPGYCHFPKNIMRNYGADYFKSLTAEVKKIKNKRVVWEKIRERNEALDCRNYATAALKIHNINLEKLEKLRIGEAPKVMKKKKRISTGGVKI
ncbi:terminase [Fusobacterium necrophorum BFTR-2]|nr:phage terminase large subunit family protein [Fusobacterium necrophorum]KDE74779.1 terminase [Fusobacterium necrophorum BFTR-2]